MIERRKRIASRGVRAAALLVALVFGAQLRDASQALAWGYTGHVLINRDAATSLPAELPGFVRSPAAVEVIAALGPELDRSKGAGKSHDADRDPGHYLDLGDDAAIAHGPLLAVLPPTREAYDTALRAAGTDQYKMGYLPYAIVDGWEQVVKDFAYWRYDDIGARTAVDPVERDWFDAERNRREMLTLRDIGVWGHFVGDASQPLHVTVHYNGWGPFANPRGYSTDRTLHARFEGSFVREYVTAAAVGALMTPYRAMDGSIEREVARYLSTTNGRVAPLYDIELAGGFAAGSPAAVGFATNCVAAGASELRDLVIDAWRSSTTATVGYPEVRMQDVLSGSVVPQRRALGND